MCGIAGYKTTRTVDPSVLSSMVEALYHRGPDSEGYHRTAGYAAGMRRLSINDVKGGGQPLFNQDLSVALLYNGEIYNSLCLRAELERKGYRFRTRSDGEVICHLYDEVGGKNPSIMLGCQTLRWCSRRSRRAWPGFPGSISR